jgi:Spy/CpxP family protein refolding chaperone
MAAGGSSNVDRHALISLQGDSIMKTAIRTLAAVLALTALALPLAAQTTPNAPSAATYDASGAYYLLHHPRALARFLGLSADQAATLLGLDKTLEQTVQPLRQARGPLCQALITDLGTGTSDPATVGAATIALSDNRQAIIAARKTFDDAFSAILTPSQLVAYDTLKQIANAIDEDFSPIGQCPKS